MHAGSSSSLLVFMHNKVPDLITQFLKKHPLMWFLLTLSGFHFHLTAGVYQCATVCVAGAAKRPSDRDQHH